MIRTLAAVVCLTLVGGIASASERFASCLESDRAEHASNRATDPDESLARLKAALAGIIDLQKRLRVEIGNDHYHRQPHIPQQLRIAEVPVVEVQKRGFATVTHAISWGAYPHDDLEVTVTASDPSLTVPAKLALNFEKHQFRFDYEIQAGEKAGEFTVTLTPAVGKVIEVRVIVK